MRGELRWRGCGAGNVRGGAPTSCGVGAVRGGAGTDVDDNTCGFFRWNRFRVIAFAH